MPRGRPKGWTPKTTRELADRLAATGHGDIRLALAAVIEDPAAPLRVRLDATRHLAGAAVSLIVNPPGHAQRADIMG